MIIHTSLLKRGICLTPWLIIIPRSARFTVGYEAHEQTHAAQQREIGVIRFWWNYIRSKSFRYSVEAEAFAAQVIAGASLDACALDLSELYGLDINFYDAQIAIIEKMRNVK